MDHGGYEYDTVDHGWGSASDARLGLAASDAGIGRTLGVELSVL